jgi:hypothetical protein
MRLPLGLSPPMATTSPQLWGCEGVKATPIKQRSSPWRRRRHKSPELFLFLLLSCTSPVATCSAVHAKGTAVRACTRPPMHTAAHCTHGVTWLMRVTRTILTILYAALLHMGSWAHGLSRMSR